MYEDSNTTERRMHTYVGTLILQRLLVSSRKLTKDYKFVTATQPLQRNTTWRRMPAHFLSNLFITRVLIV